MLNYCRWWHYCNVWWTKCVDLTLENNVITQMNCGKSACEGQFLSNISLSLNIVYSPNHIAKLLENDLRRDQYISWFMECFISFHLLRALTRVETSIEIDENSIHRWKLPLTVGSALLFTVGRSIVVLWRHISIYCDVILNDCPQNVSMLVAYVFRLWWNWWSVLYHRVRFITMTL